MFVLHEKHLSERFVGNYKVEPIISEHQDLNRGIDAFDFFIRKLQKGDSVEKAIEKTQKRFNGVKLDYGMVTPKPKYKSYLPPSEVRRTLTVWIG